MEKQWLMLTENELREKGKEYGLKLTDLDLHEIVGTLSGKVSLELDKIFKRRSIVEQVRNAESSANGWEIIIRAISVGEL